MKCYCYYCLNTVVLQDVTSYVHKIKCAVGVTGICRWHWAVII